MSCATLGPMLLMGGHRMLHRLLRQWESPPTWLILCLTLAWLQARHVPVWNAGGIGDVAGWLLILCGVALMIVSIREFSRHRTTILPRETPAAMIASGPYRFSRNPIYVADALFLAGAALIWDAGALVLVPMFMVVITRRFILGEEAGMRATFGAAFDDYAARVRRWV